MQQLLAKANIKNLELKEYFLKGLKYYCLYKRVLLFAHEPKKWKAIEETVEKSFPLLSKIVPNLSILR